MGIGSWLAGKLGRKKAAGEIYKYVLKRRDKTGGMRKVADLAEPTGIEDLYENLEAGFYVLHAYRKGQLGFEVVWGPTEVLGEAKPAVIKEAVVEETPGSQLIMMLRAFKEIKDEAKGEFALLKEIFEPSGAGGGTQKPMLDQLKELKTMHTELEGLFGRPVTSQDQAPKYEGSLPMIMHPDVIPKLIDNSMDGMERRLKKWGLIGDEGASTSSEPMFRLPDKPIKKVDSGKSETTKESGKSESKTEE